MYKNPCLLDVTEEARVLVQKAQTDFMICSALNSLTFVRSGLTFAECNAETNEPPPAIFEAEYECNDETTTHLHHPRHEEGTLK
jgi:hypothetical protein